MAKHLQDNHLDEECTFEPHFFTKNSKRETSRDKSNSKSPMESVRSYKQFYNDQISYVNKKNIKCDIHESRIDK